VILSISAAALAAVNAALFSLLAAEDPESIGVLSGIPKIMYDPILSFSACVVFLLSAGWCFIIGAIFFLKEFDPFMKLAVLISGSITLSVGFSPTLSLLIAMYRLVKRSHVLVHWWK
jgi:hypothetical protein